MTVCVLCGSDDRIDDRGPYPVCFSCAQEQLECKERQRSGEMLDRDPGPLCMKCGLCCVVLSAEAKLDEVEHLANWSGKLPTDIAMVEKDPYPAAGKIVLHRPCAFLLGRPTEYVRCRAYTTKRPAVCESYLCKLAIRYQAGLTSLNEALFILKASVTAFGDLGMFNWSNNPERDRDDSNIAEIIAARRALSMLDPDDEKVLDIGFVLFERLRKHYIIASPEKELLLSAMFTNFEGKAIELDHYFAEQDVADWSERDREVAKKTIYQVVSDFYAIFKVKKNPPEK